MKMDEISCSLPFTSNSSLAAGFHLSASLGGGAPHSFVVDTGSVGILVPRAVLGPGYQNFDPSQDTKFRYSSSGNVFWGQWVQVRAVLGVPPDWNGIGEYLFADVQVFAVDRPAEFSGGIFGIGFGIGGQSDGGPARNPLLHLNYQQSTLSPGYIISQNGIDAGLTSTNRMGFTFIALELDRAGRDWSQPLGNLQLTGGFSTDLPLLIDTGIDEMILWTTAANAPPNQPSGSPFPPGIAVTVSLPPPNAVTTPALQYSFMTGDTSQPMAPSWVEWRMGNGINTGRNVFAAVEYLYDSSSGQIGFRSAG